MTRFESLGHRIVPWAIAAGILAYDDRGEPVTIGGA